MSLQEISLNSFRKLTKDVELAFKQGPRPKDDAAVLLKRTLKAANKVGI